MCEEFDDKIRELSYPRTLRVTRGAHEMMRVVDVVNDDASALDVRVVLQTIFFDFPASWGRYLHSVAEAIARDYFPEDTDALADIRAGFAEA